MKINTRGFTLIELLIVITIIGILATVILATLNEGGAQSRDAKRQADLRNVQSALELYKNRHGRYPEGCQSAGTWSWQSGVGNDCPSGTQYIEELAPEFIRTLPTDPKPDGNNTGYAYLVNADGSVYKFVAFRTVEELSPIDSAPSNSTKLSADLGGFRLCPYVNALNTAEFLLCSGRNDGYGTGYTSYISIGSCDHNEEINLPNSYAVWGGYARQANMRTARIQTEQVICVHP